MATILPELNQFGGNSAAQQYQPYPYNTGGPYQSTSDAVYNNDQYGSASNLPGGQVQNYIQSPPDVNGANARGLRFGDRTDVGRQKKQRRRNRPGPVSARADGTPVVPLYSYPTVRNGTIVHVPLFWTALGIALGYEVRGDEVIRGLPCIKRLYQLFCRNAGSQYPMDRIETFINENRALTRRMFGEFQPPSDFAEEPLSRTRRSASFDGVTNNTLGVPPVPSHPSNDGAKLRKKRQSVQAPPAIDKGSKHLVDSCESKVEIITPYWAANSAGNIRAIVNTKHFPQAIHQEICKGSATNRCSGECICEQKYTYHRLLAYDPDNDCKGIFIDWFLFPSCCACRCPP